MSDAKAIFLHPAKRGRLSEEISSQIKEAIFSGHYKVGDRLPSQQALCEAFRVGGPVVREALRSLENSGLLFIRPGAGGGAFVKKIGSRTLEEAFEGIVKLDNISMRELTEARVAVEMGMLPLITQRIQPQDLKALDQNLEEAQESLEKGIKEPKNVKFHMLLANASHNVLLIKISKALSGIMTKLLESYEYSYERKRTVLKEHFELVNLLKAKKYEELGQALEKHIRYTLRLFNIEE